jgi:acyl transferase domain-containing protein
MTVPITAPSGLQQELLIKNLYEQHQVQKSRIRVIEAHGNIFLMPTIYAGIIVR